MEYRKTPFTVIHGRNAVAGAQDTDILLGIPRQVWDETHPAVLVRTTTRRSAARAAVRFPPTTPDLHP